MTLAGLLYTLLAIFGLGILIFIHELGHYWMARRTGMRIETFSIGFGRPLFSWERKGVKWQLGWLLFGGYVKIAGMDPNEETNLYEVPGGFYQKSHLDRIKVALAGPLINIAFAFLAFGLLWSLGGREKNYGEITAKIGWLDPHSELYAYGVRPGDTIESYDGRPFESSKDHIAATILGSSSVAVKGLKEDYSESKKIPFEYIVKLYHNPYVLSKESKTLGILAPANYLVYNRLPNGEENPLPEGSPLLGSGLEYGDRIVWVDGVPIFSSAELEALLNDAMALLTVQRGNTTFLSRVPRVESGELWLDPAFREELADWQFEAQLRGVKIQQLYTIPYNLTNDAVVENQLRFIDKEKQDEVFAQIPFADVDRPLEPGDKIIAVDGTPVTKTYQLLTGLQHRQVNIIVQRNPASTQKISWENADADMDRYTDLQELNKVAQTIGTAKRVSASRDYFLLKPVIPKTLNDFVRSPEKAALWNAELLESRKAAEVVEDPDLRARYLQHLNERESRLVLGLPIQDRKVTYNPPPTELFGSVANEIFQTLRALFGGSLNPKFLSGPVGIIQVVQTTWAISVKEALFWLAAISLNLGILNLLPIPVLDGGIILLSLIEMVTKRRIDPKTWGRVTLPFAALLILFFVFVTYHDLTRVLTAFWR